MVWTSAANTVGSTVVTGARATDVVVVLGGLAVVEVTAAAFGEGPDEVIVVGEPGPDTDADDPLGVVTGVSAAATPDPGARFAAAMAIVRASAPKAKRAPRAHGILLTA
jgi:hypothetical protein